MASMCFLAPSLIYIDYEGHVDLPEETLAGLDVTIAGMHSAVSAFWKY